MPRSFFASSLFVRFFGQEIAAWHGHRPLAVVFWGYGVLASAMLIALHAAALTSGQVALEQGLLVVSALYTVWILVAIWRCSAGAGPYWGLLARAMTIAWALNTGFVLGFLQIDLLVRHAGG